MQAPAAAIFRIHSDVANWPTWDPDTRAAAIDGSFGVGARGTLTPTQGDTVPMLLAEVVQDRCSTVGSRIPLFRMRFDHELATTDSGTEVIHRVSFFGPLALLLGPMLTKRLQRGLPVTLAKLMAAAERTATA